MVDAVFDSSLIEPENSSLLQGPGQAPPGVGLSDQMQTDVSTLPSHVMEAPGVGLAPALPAGTTPRTVKDIIAGMSPGQKVLSAIGEFGNAMIGRPSPLKGQLEQQNKERLLKMEEGKNNLKMFQEGLTVMNRIPQGADRDKFVASYAPQMGDLGTAFEAVSKQPGMSERLLNYAKDSPTLTRALQLDPSGTTAAKLLASPEASKTINMEIDAKRIPVLQSKVQILLQGAQALSPEIHDEITKRGFATPTDIGRLNELAKASPQFGPAAISDVDQAILHQHSDAVYGSVPGIATGKTLQDITKKEAEEKITHPEGVAPQHRKIQRGSQEVDQEFKGGKWVDIPGAVGPKFNPAAYISIGAPPKGYEEDPDKPGALRPVAGGPHDPNRVGAPEQRDKLQADALSMYRAKYPQGPILKTDPSPEKYVADYISKKSTGAPASEAILPPEIASKLKPNVFTGLSDGSVWTLENGKPKNVKPAKAK